MEKNLNLKVAGSIILLLLAINGYWLRNLVVTVETLRDVVTELRIVVKLQTDDSGKRLKMIEDVTHRIENLEMDLATHKAADNARFNSK